MIAAAKRLLILSWKADPDPLSLLKLNGPSVRTAIDYA
jgi:hypothetical protein